MSHFTVAVFGEDYEELLRPYDECLSVPHYITKEEIISRVRREIKDYETMGYYPEYLENPDEYIKKHANHPDHIKYITEEFPKKLQWTDEECYTDEIKYYEPANIKPNGSVFNIYNPNGKWDYYTLDGKFIPLNDGTFCNEADMEDVSVSNKDTDQYREAYRQWQLYIDGVEPESDEDRKLLSTCYYSKKYLTERYDNAEEYADAMSGFNFYAAILPSGEWFEENTERRYYPSSNTATDNHRQWRKQKKDIIRMAKENNWHVTLIDCHI